MATKGLNLVKLGAHYHDEESARKFLEALRWPEGPYCPHCGSTKAYRLRQKVDSKKPGRPGLVKCGDCKKQYTVTVGTIFEASHIKLHKWLLAIHLLCSSKKGMSAHQLHRMLGVQYKTAWFMAHRIRFGMSQSPMAAKLTGIVEVDEVYVGPRRNPGAKRGAGTNKAKVLALVQRGGDVRTFHMEEMTAQKMQYEIRKNVAPTARIMTDENPQYKGLNKDFASHEHTNHSRKEYVRGDVTTNTIEGFFGILKRGINGVYQHVSKQHLHRYLAEFEFRYNQRRVDDGPRTLQALNGFEGRRLYYRDSSAPAN
jgi:transposase-like protein